MSIGTAPTPPSQVAGSPLVLYVRGEHDLATASALSATLAAGHGLGTAPVIIDLSGVTFMDVAAVNVLQQVGANLAAAERTLRLRRPSTSASRILDLCESVAPLGLVRDASDPSRRSRCVPPSSVARAGTVQRAG